jgi:hypothetical protein
VNTLRSKLRLILSGVTRSHLHSNSACLSLPILSPSPWRVRHQGWVGRQTSSQDLLVFEGAVSLDGSHVRPAVLHRAHTITRRSEGRRHCPRLDRGQRPT